MTLSRRSLFGGVGAFLAAPAIVRAASLMPVSRLSASPVWIVTAVTTDTLELTIEEFQRRIMNPAIARLAAVIERERAGFVIGDTISFPAG